MPSTVLFGLQSGGQPLVSGDVFSGAYPLGRLPIGNLAIRLSSLASGVIYVGLPSLSGASTLNSGGNLASGGMGDALELAPGQTLTISNARLVSGILTPRIHAPALQSGFRVYWDSDVSWSV